VLNFVSLFSFQLFSRHNTFNAHVLIVTGALRIFINDDIGITSSDPGPVCNVYFSTCNRGSDRLWAEAKPRLMS